MTEPKFKSGDIVRLKGSPQHMVVQRMGGLLGDIGLESYADGTPVHWVDKNGRPQAEYYEADCLELVDAPEAL